MKNKDEIFFMSQVAEEIIKIKVRSPRAMKTDFYNIMRKYGIKQGTLTKGGGRQCANFEWTMCYTLFIDKVASSMQFNDIFSVPKDLSHY